jgi:hypothetical protein
MDRRSFVQLAGTSSAALALAPGDLLFPGGDAVARVTPRQSRAALDRLRGERPCRAEVRSERGGPRLFVNGQETVPVWGLSISLLETAENFEGMGMRLLQPQMGMASAWTGPGQYDFTALEAYLGRVLALAPDAYFFPRVQLLTPAWWKEAHPDETMRFGLDVPARYWDGWRTRPADNPLREGDHQFTNFYGEAWEASYASDVWRRDTADMLRALVRFIEGSPLAARMMGYFFVHGNTEEWNVGGDNWWPGYEAPMQREAGPVPTPAERLDASFGLLRDPAKEADVIRFYRRFHEVRAETIAELARALKEEMTTPVLTGTFFGYLMETPRIHESGHLAPKAVLDSPHVDVVACPYTYVATNDPAKARWESDLYDGAENWLGRSRGVGGDGSFRSMVESYRRRGKLYVSEIDPGSYRHRASVWKEIGGSGSMTAEGTVNILRRDFGNVLSAASGGWLYDFGPYNFSDWGLDEATPGGWYGSPEIITAVGEVVRMMRARLDADISSVARVVVAGDPEGFLASRHWLHERPWPGQGIRYTDLFNHWFFNAQARALYRGGQPVDLLYRDDLTAEDYRRYRLVLVPNSFLLTPEQVDTLHERLRGSGATVIWYYAPGLLRPEQTGRAGGVDLAQMERLTGFRFYQIDDPGPMLIEGTVPGAGTRTFGIMSPSYYSPRFSVAPGDGVEPLGHWTVAEPTPAGGPRTALARRPMDGWTSVYAGTAPLPAEFLRQFAAEAGAAPWTDRPAVVNGSRAGAMVVCTDPPTAFGAPTGATERPTPAPLTVTFPFPMRDEAGGEPRTVHTLPLRFGDVRLFTP